METLRSKHIDEMVAATHMARTLHTSHSLTRRQVHIALVCAFHIYS